MPTERRSERIERERREMALKPWQRSPSEVTDDDPPVHPVGTVGHESWLAAQKWRKEIRARQPDYFACESDPAYWTDDVPTPKGRKK